MPRHLSNDSCRPKRRQRHLGNACAWVDVADALSPESAAAAGLDLSSLLWLRMSAERRQKLDDRPWSRLEQALTATDLLLQAGGFAAIVLDLSDVLPQHTMRVWRRRISTLDALAALPVTDLMARTGQTEKRLRELARGG